MEQELTEIREEIADKERHLAWAVRNNVHSIERRVQQALSRLQDELANLLTHHQGRRAA